MEFCTPAFYLIGKHTYVAEMRSRLGPINGFRRFERTTIIRNFRKYKQHSTEFYYIKEDEFLQMS
jgi:hypothetical protein